MTDRRLKLEPLERRLLLAADFGDAPSPYDTLLADNGARHEAVGPMLGTSRDSETDGLPTLNADGDGFDDGVTFGVMRAGQLDASIIVNVQNAPLGAELDAWIDFNGDGSWGGAGERIAASVSVVEGDNVIYFTVPTNIAPGETYARFRLSTAGGLNIAGPAADGEVEDYRIEIAPARGTLGFFSEEHAIEVPSVSNSYHAVDLDGDGDQDLISSGSLITWLENDGGGNLTEHPVGDPVSSGYISTTGDVDLDGDIDVVSVSLGYLYWFENDGSQGFTQHRITTGQGFPKTAVLVDWDADGDVDIISASAGPDRGFVAYVNNGNQVFAEQIILPSVSGSSIHGIYSANPIDMDLDGDLDVVVAGRGVSGGITWYQNNGAGQFAEQAIYPIGIPSRDTTGIWPTDLDGDGDVDIAFAVNSNSTDGVGWLENNGAGYFDRRIISYDVVDPSAISVADANGDGTLDVLVSSDNWNAIELFRGNTNHNFTKTTVADANDGYNFSTPIIADFDGDGDLDVVTSDSQRRIVWYEAYPTGHHVAAFPSGLIEDSTASSTVTFTRTGDLSAEETFSFTVLGSATFGTDYAVSGATLFEPSTGSITFPAGESTATLTITPIADDDFEGDETITIRIADYADIGLPAQPDNPTDAVVTILHDEPADFGDAADTYLTTAASNGPSHGASGPMLGATRDAETDGLPTQLADGDGADDDGVTFGTLHAGQQDGVITVNVQNAPSGARLDAWFDFDGDGNFLGPDEQVVTSVLVIEGDNVLPIDIPATARSGETTVRFRLSTAGGLTYVGYSVDGEVEDYRVTISPPAAADGVFSARPPISMTNAATEVVTADLDGDGDADVISASQGNSIDWHENQGDGQFLTHNITTTGNGANAIRVVDLDRDGDLDLIAALNSRIIWYKNDGDQVFAVNDLTAGAPLFEAEDVHAADIDGDGDLDIVAFAGRPTSDGTVVWFENYGDEEFSPAITIAETRTTMAIALADVNADGHIDIVATAGSFPAPTRIALLLNDGLGNFTRNDLTSTTPIPNIASIAATDLDSDGDLDIVFSSTGPLVAWFENDGVGGFSTWQIIDTAVSITRVIPADVDGDGHIDLVAASYANSAAYWYKNDGGADPLFTRIEIAADGLRRWSIATGDLDGDGDLDVVTSAYTGNRIEWFESIPANSGDFDGDGDVDGRDFLAWQRGASPTPVAGNDLADWQATYGYTAHEPPAAFQGDRAETASVIAAVSAVDEVLAEAVIAPAPGGFILPSPSTARVSRSNKILLRPATHLHHDRVFAELAAPSRTFIRDFGDIVIRRTMPERFSISGSFDE